MSWFRGGGDRGNSKLEPDWGDGVPPVGSGDGRRALGEAVRGSKVHGFCTAREPYDGHD